MPIRQVLLVPHTHHDVGYTNSPRIVDRRHGQVVGEVLRLAAAHAGPGPDQFRWTFEAARPVLTFLRSAAPDDIAALRELAASGRISVTGGYLNMTQLPSQSELDDAYELLDPLRRLGLRVRTEQHGDVNGISWGATDGMRRAGIERLVMALNPDHGRPPFEQPTGFWWVAPSGARVFVWLSTHYGVGEEWGIVDGDTALALHRISDFVKQLDARTDYPYGVAIVHAANDNRWPTAKLLDVVRAWNRAHRDLVMRTATIDEALDAVLPDAGDAPVVRGEWSDWWSHGHGSTAREVAVYREARSFARAARAGLALALLRGDPGPELAEVIGYRRGPVRLGSEDEIVAGLAEVDEQLLLFGEHTWGSWETYSKPDSTFSHSHRNAKGGFAYAAYDLARDLAIEGMHRLATAATVPISGPRVLVVNPTERDRTEPAVVEIDGRHRIRMVVQAPAFGSVVQRVPAPPRRRQGHALANDRYRVVVDPRRGGVVSLTDLRSGRELVDSAVPHGLAALVVEQVAPGARHPMLDENPKLFCPEHPGPEFVRRSARGAAEPEITESADVSTISWQGSAPGVPSVTTTLSLYGGLEMIDVEVDLVKPEHLGPESIFVAFPFLVPAARFLMETAGAVYLADTEQLPDTSRDWYSIQHAIGITNDHVGVLWGSVDAPLVQVGGFHTGRWARRLQVRGGHVNSWLMNNLHFTNFQARQDGTRRYRYRFAPTSSEVTRAQVHRVGRDLIDPLGVRQYVGSAGAVGRTGLRVQPADALFAEVRPLGAGTVRVRLRNPSDESVQATVAWDGSPGQRFSTVVDAHGVADVLLRTRR